MTTPMNTDRRGKARASLFHGAPILSELGACVRPHGHDGDHSDPWDRRWNVNLFHPRVNTDKGAGE
ncbi:hypothetical protein [Streptomyces sp. GQFP]|uniref:hypothetical protein n=1 Tax=Streptomyces sp. GQFP TaxID=2907545 RepID=UPI001F3C9826|nr:hypothetical protein [Streptomyces sp. GQFP]UIX33428.1 hypothetical protein LUX31_27380 [Streptomyces sp. GQFP]